MCDSKLHLYFPSFFLQKARIGSTSSHIDPRFHLNFRSWRIETQCVKRTLLIANFFYIVGKDWAKIGRTRLRKSSPDWITPCVSGLAWLRSTTTIYRGNSGAASHPQTWTHFAISYVIQFGRQVQYPDVKVIFSPRFGRSGIEGTGNSWNTKPPKWMLKELPTRNTKTIANKITKPIKLGELC